MTMHLAHPALSLTGKKKGKQKFRNAEEARKSRELDASWQELLARHRPTVKVSNKRGSLSDSYKLTVPADRSTRQYPSLDTGLGVATKPAPKVYTGDKIVGIAAMHKSNLVPVFNEQAAKDISKMRRG